MINLAEKHAINIRLPLRALLFLLIVSVMGASVILPSPDAGALASASNWRAGRIIDDSLFYNNNDMTVQEIQAFLNEKVPNCDTYGTQRYNASLTNAQYAASRGWPGPAYVCLKDYYQVPRSDQNINNLSTNVIPAGAISAAEIIKIAADTYTVSPRVLLVTLEKESLNLLKDTWPLPIQYKNPMGYGCPDTAPCDPTYEGFYNQMMNAARQFKLYKNNPASYRYKSQQDNTISFQANSPSCGASVVFIETAATAGLYNYTPYQPNQAALNNLYGTGDACSAYGNRNFWRIFTDWFGGTTGADYAWQVINQDIYNDEEMTVLADTSILAPNKEYFFKIRVINSGNKTWRSTDSNQVLLGTTNAENRASPLCNTSWVNCSRPAGLSESSVAPGEYGTFVFRATIPSAGRLTEYFNLVAEGKTWFNNFGFHWQLNVLPPTARWQPESQIIYADSERTRPVNTSALAPNTTYYATVIARNKGNTAWLNSGASPTRLGTSSPLDRSSLFSDSGWVSANRAATIKEPSVSPGNVGSFDFTLTTPAGFGIYNEYFRPVTEGLSWMNDVGMYWPVIVSAPTSLWSVVSQSAYTDSSGTQAYNTGETTNGDRIFLSIKQRNTGNTIWRNTGPNPTRLGTSAPLDRTSEFYDSSWLSPNRAANLKEASVAPGEIGTFEFWVKSPYKVNGATVREYFRPVVEGLAWMNDIGMYQSFTFSSPSTSWEYINQDVSASSTFETTLSPDTNLSSNTPYFLRLNMKNTSGEVWQRTSFLLGTSNPIDRASVFYDSSWQSVNRTARLKQNSVAPGSVGTFEFTIRTPASSGDYNEYFRPVIEGKTWLTDIGLHWLLKVR